jgi:hypothetical protein
MATQKVCDVFGTAKDAMEVSIVLTYEGATENGEPRTILAKTVDLGPRGLERLLTKVEAGLKPPALRPRKKEEVVDESV